VVLKGRHRRKTTNEGKNIHQKLKYHYKNFGKEPHAGKQTLNFDWFAPHFRHRFVTNFHYDGTIQRHLGAQTN